MSAATQAFALRTAHRVASAIDPGDSLTVGLAITPSEVQAAQRLRHQVFCGEMGATLRGGRAGIDSDAFDPFCAHLVVRDATQQVVATTRLLTPERAIGAGGYYSEREFDLTPLLASGVRILEIGRTCVHRDHRRGGALAMLWLGLARCFELSRYDWLMGCASIPFDGARTDVRAACHSLAPRYLVEPELRVTPRRAVPDSQSTAAAELPPLLLAYLRLGARIGGEPCWDPDFKVADLLVLLDPKRIEARYARHFLPR